MPRPGPFRREFTLPLHALQSELNRLFDEYWGPSRFGSGPRAAAPTDLEPSSWSPALDLTELADAYVVTVEVPGVEPASIDLSMTGNVLTVRGAKPPEEGEGPPAGSLRERVYGPFYRQVVLPGEVNFEGAGAESRLGVLKIRLPKREAAKARTIPVQSR